MKAVLYEWMKTIAGFYLLLTVFLHLLPDSVYEKYIRFFMGMLLMVLLSSPFFELLGKGDHFLTDFSVGMQKEDRQLAERAEEFLEQYIQDLMENMAGQMEKRVETQGEEQIENQIENQIEERP